MCDMAVGLTGKRVLVLENDSKQLDNYRRRLEREGFAVDASQDLGEAIDLAERRVFSAAVVDLMLEDPVRHDTYDGTLLLRALREIGDGTQAVVVSAQDDTELAWELQSEYPAFSYVRKSRLVREGFGLLVDRVTQAVAAVDPESFTSNDSLYIQLFGRHGEYSHFDENQMAAFFRPRGGPLLFRKELGLTLRALLPLCAPCTAAQVWAYDHPHGRATQSFWSKGLGDRKSVV